MNPSLFSPTHCPCPRCLLLQPLAHRDKCTANEMRSSSVTAPKRTHKPQPSVREGIPVDVRGWGVTAQPNPPDPSRWDMEPCDPSSCPCHAQLTGY